MNMIKSKKKGSLISTLFVIGIILAIFFIAWTGLMEYAGAPGRTGSAMSTICIVNIIKED